MGKKPDKFNFKHGMSKTWEYTAWTGMKNRCYCVNSDAYKHYGGRGIKVCDRWLNSFQNFLYDMGPRPSSEHSIDRIDVNGDYEPNNCRWAMIDVQANNRRNSVYYKYMGEKLTAPQLSREYNVGLACLSSRLKSGWDVHRALTEPVKQTNKDTELTLDGITMSPTRWAKYLDIKYNTLMQRLKRGWTIDKALREYYTKDKNI